MIELTVVLIKPDAVKGALIGQIIHRFEETGLKIKAMKMVWVTKDLVAKHYSDREEFLRGHEFRTFNE